MRRHRRLPCLLLLALYGPCHAIPGTPPDGRAAKPLHAWNFDRTEAPALPAGWRARTRGDVPGWRTAGDWTDTPPNAAYVQAGRKGGVSALYSPVVTLPWAELELRFRHRWVVEYAPYEGGVLEIAIDGGRFVDIVEAGGRFRLGGYNNTVFRCCGGNPIGGRRAWSSPSQARFLTTRVDLPVAAAGRSVQFRWRFGSSAGATGTVSHGWWLDSIELDLAPAPPPLHLGLSPVAIPGTYATSACRADSRRSASFPSSQGPHARSFRSLPPLPEEAACPA